MTTLLHTSLAAIPLILGIALARRYLRKKMPPQVFVLLWTLVLCRLLIPVWVPVSGEGVKPFLNHVYGGLYNATRQTVGAVNQTVVFALWLIGAVAALAYMLVNHFKSSWKWREALPLENPAAEIWLAQHPCRRRVRVAQAERVGTPFCIGTFRPLIVLPAFMADAPDQEIAYVMAHERAHIRGFHAALKYALLAACSIHWFNPLVWLMAALFQRDMELAADEGVLRLLGRKEARNYARTLLEMEKRASCPAPGLSLAAADLQERLEMMIKAKPKSKGLTIMAFTIIVSGFLLLVGAPIEGGFQPDQHLYHNEDWDTYLTRISSVGYHLSEEKTLNNIF